MKFPVTVDDAAERNPPVPNSVLPRVERPVAVNAPATVEEAAEMNPPVPGDTLTFPNIERAAITAVLEAENAPVAVNVPTTVEEA